MLCSVLFLAFSTSLCALDGMDGGTAPLKNVDPLGLSQLRSDETGSVLQSLSTPVLLCSPQLDTLSRVPASTSPDSFSSDTFESLSGMKPLDAWDAGQIFNLNVCPVVQRLDS